jgi:adenine-specific DNA methylase
MSHAPDRRLTAVTDEDIERVHKALRGLERRVARLGARPHKPVEPILDAVETPDLSK